MINESKFLMKTDGRQYVAHDDLLTINNKEITYIWSNEPKKLHDYCQMRDIGYKKILNLKNFSGGFDEMDLRSHFVLGILGEKCVAGARITVCDAGADVTLPLEDEDYLLEDKFPNFGLDNCKRAEISRLSITDTDLIQTIGESFYYEISEKVKSLNAKYLFISSAKFHKRRFLPFMRKFFKQVIFDDFEMPDKEIYEGNKMFLVAVEV